MPRVGWVARGFRAWRATCRSLPSRCGRLLELAADQRLRTTPPPPPVLLCEEVALVDRRVLGTPAWPGRFAPNACRRADLALALALQLCCADTKSSRPKKRNFHHVVQPLRLERRVSTQALGFPRHPPSRRRPRRRESPCRAPPPAQAGRRKSRALPRPADPLHQGCVGGRPPAACTSRLAGPPRGLELRRPALCSWGPAAPQVAGQLSPAAGLFKRMPGGACARSPRLLYSPLCAPLPWHPPTCRTVLGVSGADFAIIASDTRLSEGYSIHTRNSPKTYKL